MSVVSTEKESKKAVSETGNTPRIKHLNNRNS